MMTYNMESCCQDLEEKLAMSETIRRGRQNVNRSTKFHPARNYIKRFL